MSHNIPTTLITSESSSQLVITTDTGSITVSHMFSFLGVSNVSTTGSGTTIYISGTTADTSSLVFAADVGTASPLNETINMITPPVLNSYLNTFATSNSLELKISKVYPNLGGTGLNTLTPNSLLVGQGTNPVALIPSGFDGQALLGATSNFPQFNTITSVGGTITFTTGSNSLNMDVNLSLLTFFNPLQVGGGGTGRTFLTVYGVLVGEGSFPIDVTAAGTSGQVFIASTGSDPQFATITSTGNSLTFTLTPHGLNIEVNLSGNSFFHPLSVSYGGTGQTLLTAHGVLLGEGSLPIMATNPGTNGQVLIASTTGNPQFSTITSTGLSVLFTAGPHSLNMDVNLTGLTFFPFFSVPKGGTGLTVLTTHGALIGEGSLPINVTAAGTNGQALIGSTTGDPQFASISSTGGSLTFTFGPNSLNIEMNLSESSFFNPLPIEYGGTGNTVLTTYGVLLGEGSLPVQASPAGTDGQVLIGSTDGDPLFSTITSSGQTLTFTFGPNSLNIEVNLDVVTFSTPSLITPSSGGTGLTVLTAYGILIGEGSLPVHVTTAGTDGQTLIASSGNDPQFTNITSSSGTLTFTFGPNALNIDLVYSELTVQGNFGTATSLSNVLNFTGSNGITTLGTGSIVTIQLNLDSTYFSPLPIENGSTGQTLLTAYGVLIGEGSLNVHVTAAGTDGQLFLASSSGDPAFATITSNQQTLTFTFGPNSLNLDVSLANITPSTPLPVTSGGTGQTFLTVYGVLLGEGSLNLHVTAAGTNGQTLIASSSGDPAFATLTSSGQSLSFTFGYNSLAMDVNVAGNPFFNPLQVGFGGTGQTFLTAHGVLIGEGSLPIEGAQAGTDGQLLIASSLADPKFATITSTGGTLSFTFGYQQINVEINLSALSFFSLLSVSEGGLGQTLLTAYGVLIGEGSSNVQVTSAGTNGQILLAATNQNPAFATLTSTGQTVTFTFGPNALNLEIDLLKTPFFNPLIVSDGGTGRTILTTYGVLIGEGSLSAGVSSPGTNGQVFLASTTGSPQFNTITSSGGSLTFTWGPNFLGLDINLLDSPLFPLPVGSGGTGRTILTSYGVLIGEGSLNINVSDRGTDGQLLIGSTTGDPAFATLTSSGGTLSFIFGHNALTIEVLPLSNFFFVDQGGTGLTILTAHGILLGEGSLNIQVTSAGTNGQVLLAATTKDPKFATITSTGATLTFTFGPNSLNLDVNLLTNTFFNPLQVDHGGTGQTLLTAYGVLIGEGSLPLHATAPGTNGQLLIASTTGDPAFATISSTGGTLIFTAGPHSLNIDVIPSAFTFTSTLPIEHGGTGLSLLTTHGVLIGEGSLDLHVTAAGTHGQVLLGTSGADPLFATLSSTGGTLTFNLGPNALNIEVNLSNSYFNPVQVGSGGTGLTILTAHGILIGEGSLPLHVTNPGTNGQVLIASTTGDPAFATITSSGNTLTFTLAPGGLNIELNLSLSFFNPLLVESGGTGRTILTTYGVLIGEGSLPVNVTSPGTNGQILLASTTEDPQFATLTSTGNSLTFQFGPNSLNIELFIANFTLVNEIGVERGGTGRTVLTTHGVLVGEGSLPVNVTSPGTNGQVLIAGTAKDPLFTNITSTGNTITFTFGPNSLDLEVNLLNNTYFAFLFINSGGTNQTLLTTYGVLIGEGSLPIHVTDPGTDGQVLIASTTGDPLFTNITSTGNTITSTFGPHSLNLDLNLVGNSFFNPLLVATGGTGQTILTTFGVLLGEGSLAVHVTDAGTDGQALIASTTGDPQFATITSLGNTITFSFAPNALNIEVSLSAVSFAAVMTGTTGRTLLTAYGVLIGEGSLEVNVTAAGTDGQLLLASSTGDPQFGTLTSTGNTIAFIFGHNSLNLDFNITGSSFFNPLQVDNGGTGQTLFTSFGVLIGEGSLPVQATNPGTNGQVLLASTTGNPQFATLSSTGGSLTFTPGAHSLNLEAILSSLLALIPPLVSNGETGRTVLTAYGVLVGEGSLPVNVTNAGTNGQVLLASTTGDPQFATFTSTGGTLTFTFGPNTLNIDFNPTSALFFNPLAVGFGGTGQTLLTLYGALIGEGSNSIHTTAAGTNGQTLIASTTGDPKFSNLTSTGNSLTFTFGPGSLNIDVNFYGNTFFNPLLTSYGGTGLTLLTTYGVLIGGSSLQINATAPGTQGQVLIGASGAEPQFATLTSTGGSFTFTFGPNSLNIDLIASSITFFNSVFPVTMGATGRSVLTAYGVLIGEGSLSVHVTKPATNGQILLGSTTGDPQFATITSTGNSFTFTFGPNSLNIDISLASTFLNPLSVGYGGTGRTVLATQGVLIGEGSLPINATIPGTNGQILIAKTTGDPKFATITSTGRTLTFTFGPNSLNIEAALTTISFFNPLQVGHGGTGRTLLTAYGVLVGKGSLNVHVTNPGTNGQVLIASATGDPEFATITSTGGTLSFTFGFNSLNINVNWSNITLSGALPVSSGSTGRSILTTYGVLIGEGSLPVNVTAAGTNGQILIARTAGDPQFASISSSGNTLTFTFGPSSLNIDINPSILSFFTPLKVGSGGTGKTFLTTYGVLLGEGSLSVHVTNPGTNGQVLIAATGADPQFANITSTGNTLTLTFTPGSNSLNLDINLTNTFLNFLFVANGGTGLTILTTYGVLVGEGSLPVHVTNPGINGQLLISSTTGDPAFATVTSTGGTLTFTRGPNSLNIEVFLPSLTFFTSLPPTNGGTGRSLLTAHGVLIGEGSLPINVTAAGTNGQVLIAMTAGDPQFANVTSTGGTLTFTYGPNSLNAELSLFSSALFNPLPVGNGGTGRTILTTYGVLIGEGSSPINVTAPGTNGQVLIASTLNDPKFANLTSAKNTLTFTFGYNSLNINLVYTSTLFNPFQVNNGGTGRTILTTYGVLIGEGSLPIHVTAAGTNGQVLIGASGADPAFATITSTQATLTFTFGPNSLNIDINFSNNLFNPLPVGNGGTGRTVFTAYGVLLGEGNSPINTSNPGTNGQTLIGATGADPQFATITSSGGTLTFTFGPNSLNIDIVSGQAFFNPLQVRNGGTGQVSLTAHGVLIGEGSLSIHATEPGTNGQVLIASTTGDPSFSNLTSTGNSLLFTFSGTSVNIDINFGITFFNPLQVANGGTGRTVLNPYQVLCGGTASTSALQSVPLANTLGLVLTSNGPGQLPAFENTTYINQVLITIFQNAGAGVYIPTPGMIYCQVECIGGGGGGGGITIAAGSGTNSAAGGGGGGGGYAKKVFSAAEIGGSATLAIGSGGTAGSSGGGNGGNGSSSTFGSSLLVASGGSGGSGQSYSATTSQIINVLLGGSGGTDTGGDVNISGQTGYPGWAISDNDTLFAAFSGQGGSSFFLGTGLPVWGVTTLLPGTKGDSFGAGGNGAIVSNQPFGNNGSIGIDGAIIITEYVAALKPS